MNVGLPSLKAQDRRRAPHQFSGAQILQQTKRDAHGEEGCGRRLPEPLLWRGGEIEAKGVGNSELTNWRALDVPKEKVQYCGTRIV